MYKNALLVIDMQNDFLDPAGPFGDRDEEGMPPELIPNVVACVERARSLDWPVIHVIQEHRADGVDFGRELDCSLPHCIEGTWGAQISPQLPVLDRDYRVIKRRFSGFLATDLDLLLRGLGVDQVVICGIAGDGCVRATAVDAHQLGYRMRVVPSAVAGLTRASCAAALSYLDTLQRDVLVGLDDLARLAD